MSFSAFSRGAETFGMLGSRHKPRPLAGRKTWFKLPGFWYQCSFTAGSALWETTPASVRQSVGALPSASCGTSDP